MNDQDILKMPIGTIVHLKYWKNNPEDIRIDADYVLTEISEQEITFHLTPDGNFKKYDYVITVDILKDSRGQFLQRDLGGKGNLEVTGD